MKSGYTNKAVRNSVYLAACVWVAVLAGACRIEEDNIANAPTETIAATESESTEENRKPSPPQNVLFVVLDAAAAKRMSVYGYEQPTTPFLDALAAKAIVFESAYSQNTATLASAWSYLTGKYPYIPGHHLGRHRIRSEDETLASLFHDSGYATAGFSGNPFVSGNFGFDKGFDEFVLRRHQRPATRQPPAKPKEEGTSPNEPGGRSWQMYWRDTETTESLLDDALQWMLTNRDSPWFCYVHLLRPHNPYYVGEPFLSRYVTGDPPKDVSLEQFVKQIEFKSVRKAFEQSKQALNAFDEEANAFDAEDPDVKILAQMYSAQMAYTDALIEKMFHFLKANDLLQDTLVIVASDHGEAFGEHGDILHSTEPYEELIRVPLLVYPSESLGWPTRRVQTPVELVDLVPTLIELFGLRNPGALDGQSVLSTLRGGAYESGPFLVSEGLGVNALSIRVGDLKLIATLTKKRKAIRRVELYDLASDPGESVNLAEKRTESVNRLLAYARAYLRAQTSSSDMPPSRLNPVDIEILEALGYVFDSAGDNEK